MMAAKEGPRDTALITVVRAIWEDSRTQAARTVNTHLVQANWLIGRQIVEAQQAGQDRAGYGKELLATLSSALRKEYGSGFSVTGLQPMRAFYLAYPDLLPIQHAVRVEFASKVVPLPSEMRPPGGNPAPGWKPGSLHPSLSWIHYRDLLKVDRRDARDFYEIEAIRNAWSGRALERQIHSLLFFRILLCSDQNDSGVRFVLGPDNQQVFASRYKLSLPTEDALRAELDRELARLEAAPRRSGAMAFS